MRYTRMKICSILTAAVLLAALVSCTDSNKATLFRDRWGVPHIYADSERALVFAFGYVQAQDRLIQLLTSYRYAEGSLAEAFGADHLESDAVQRIWRHAEISRQRFGELSQRAQQLLRAFTAGIQLYLDEHPEKVPDWAPEIQPWHPVALGRAYIWGWPLGQAMGDLRRGLRGEEAAAPHHSNQWAVSPSRTAQGVPIALIDPHLSFETSGHWYEARLFAGEIEVSGMCVVGTPLVALGHNRRISWAATTGGPDCADIYQLEINPDNANQYRYDGEWRDISADTLVIPVRTDDGIEQREHIVERCHYGPIHTRRGNAAYAVRCAYENEFTLLEQMLQMNCAQNLAEFKEALSLCQFMPQNIMFASIDGDIYYARTGCVPVRPPEYDWNRPVPGNTSASEWHGIHPHEDLVQITNPECGFMQNCNISPGTMMPDSPLTPDRYPDYIYNDSQFHSNPRGRRAVALLGAEESLIVERAKEIALDTSVDGYEIWQGVLQTAFKATGGSYPALQETVELILEWNGRLDADQTAATLYRFWRRECNALGVRVSIDHQSGTVEFRLEDQKDLLTALQRAKVHLNDKFGTSSVPWGEAVRLRRGEKSWPVSGGSFENEISVLRAAGGPLDPETGITTVRNGQSCCTVVLLTDPIRSWSILPWGQSDDPDSPHFDDQAEALFSKSTFKSSFFNRDELMRNLKSTEVMVVP